MNSIPFSPPPLKQDRLPANWLEQLSEDELLGLFAGKDAWHFAGVERLGLPPLQVADCGHGLTLVAPPYGSATCFPTSVGMAATWNRELLFRVGEALGRESRGKNCAMLLGPMVNLHRLPNGGRNYETFSEDPVLTARLAAALCKGLQNEGTGACVKSFLCNNQQKNQKMTSSEVDPRTLRELYLKVYALIFEEVEPWAVMTSYNPVNGHHPSDSAYWLESVLRGELGFKGIVVSDWRAVQGEGALASGLDIEMPGPGRVLTPAGLRQALLKGKVSFEQLKERASRILELHEKARLTREGIFHCSPPEVDSPRHRLLAREVAEESIVLLRNEGSLLPVEPSTLRRVAVIGPNAACARLGGGGSASVSPFYAVSPLTGLRQSLPPTVEVLYAEGCSLSGEVPAIPSQFLAVDADSAPGSGLRGAYYSVEAFEAGQAPSSERIDANIDFSWGWAAPAAGLPREYYAMRWTGCLCSPVDGPATLHLATRESVARVFLDGECVLDCWSEWDPHNFEDGYTNRQGAFELTLRKGQLYDLVIEYRKTGTKAGLRFGWDIPGQPDSIAQAVELARQSDLVIVIGGLSNMFEGGNHDRNEFTLPGRQDELILTVAAANPHTVVVLCNGTPVCMESWRSKVPAILEAFYPGQEGGNALARIILGEINPSGKLPDTIPCSWEQVEGMRNYPGDNGKVNYAEGLFTGYRDFDRNGQKPAFPFGFGLSYTTFEYSSIGLSDGEIAPGETVELDIKITNVGQRQGKEIVQLYLEPVEPQKQSPIATLLDFCKIDLAPRQTFRVTFSVRYKDLLSYCPETGGWVLLTRYFRLRVGPHSRAGEGVYLRVNQTT